MAGNNCSSAELEPEKESCPILSDMKCRFLKEIVLWKRIYLYIHICMCVFIDTYVYTHVYTQMYTHVCVLITQSCLTLCDPMNCSPPGSSVHGISQARKLELAAISFSRGSSWPRDQIHVSFIDSWILYHWTTWVSSCCAVFSCLIVSSSLLYTACTAHAL